MILSFYPALGIIHLMHIIILNPPRTRSFGGGAIGNGCWGNINY
ncbi:MAG TPA: hypothetical protein VGA29_02535 [Ignavibacteriaceae bacterium]